MKLEVRLAASELRGSGFGDVSFVLRPDQRIEIAWSAGGRHHRSVLDAESKRVSGVEVPLSLVVAVKRAMEAHTAKLQRGARGRY